MADNWRDLMSQAKTHQRTEQKEKAMNRGDADEPKKQEPRKTTPEEEDRWAAHRAKLEGRKLGGPAYRRVKDSLQGIADACSSLSARMDALEASRAAERVDARVRGDARPAGSNAYQLGYEWGLEGKNSEGWKQQLEDDASSDEKSDWKKGYRAGSAKASRRSDSERDLEGPATAMPDEARVDGEKKGEETVQVGGRIFKIHQERDGPGGRWTWRYEAGNSSINGMTRQQVIDRLEEYYGKKK